MKNKPGFCYEIFKNQAFWSHNGSISYNPCCSYDGFIDHDIGPDQSWFGPNHRKIIDIIQQDQMVPGCHGCYEEEKAGRQSRRQSSKINYENFLQSDDINTADQGPQGIDYSVGNLCNLKCIICGPHNSSSWISDYQKIYPERNIDQYFFKKKQQVGIINDSFLQNIKSLHFHGGGEPLMSNEHIDLLRRIDSIKGLKDVRVFYNTNGTQTVTDETLELWGRCRLIEIYFSIDDVDQRFEYQRTGAKWDDVQANIEWFKVNMPHNHMFNVNCVWSYLNLYYLDELWCWYQDTLSSNRYGDPCRLILQKANGPFEIRHLNASAIKILREKFSNYPTLLALLNNIKMEERDHATFWKMIQKIDHMRNMDFRSICSEWSALL